MTYPLTLLNLDEDPVPVPTPEPPPVQAKAPPEPPQTSPPVASASTPSEPQRPRTIWDDRLFDPVGGIIPLDEPLMLLRAEDPAAAEIAELWAERVQGFAPAQAAEARATAARMRAWRMRKNAIVY